MPYGSGLKFAPSFTYQPEQVAERLARGCPGKTVVDLGAGGRKIVPWAVAVDFVEGPGTDVHCDFVKGRTPFPDASVDLVIATGILEHVEDGDAFMAEVSRILRPGGLVHVEIPFMQQYHDDPIDCRRYTMPGLAGYLRQRGFEPKDTGIHIGPAVTWLTITSYFLDMVFGLLGKTAGNLAFAAFSYMAWPLRYLDRLLIKLPNAHRLAFGVYCTAAKV